ncbi:hypothetical protein GCM10007973_17440 [Polymorphobacter multimanifer]|uniref:17 kDa surface antigen n=1 Tax=Polymorphobacter multimanifer TaxID=1070431 RepID=A0A841LGE5_9SPHN|nr:glycine zipper 2TM domain-containing protein [Polymorphobacter multimanifer]MBB6228038.1 hypothetical protein [Polymorphobacter multimanifer]GGI81472.1 hypothetical protein GCM10007973_17440 [Polymorphobacter multimanifer]
MAGKFLVGALVASFALTTMSTAAVAHDRDDRYYGRDGYYTQVDDRRFNDRRFDDRRFNNRRVDSRRYDDRRWNNNARGQNRCYDEGKGGTVIGAIAGGLLGNQVAGRNDGLLGAVLGGGVGALAGRAIDKSDGRPCR